MTLIMDENLSEEEQIQQIHDNFMHNLKSVYKILPKMTDHEVTQIGSEDQVTFQVNNDEFYITLKFGGEIFLSFNSLMCPSRVFKLMKEFQTKNIVATDCDFIYETNNQ